LFWGEAIDKSGFIFIPILIFAHENSVEKSFLGCTLQNYFITVLQIGELFTQHKIFLGSIWQVYSTKKTNKSLLSFESIDNA
jgi:hypothetical protein